MKMPCGKVIGFIAVCLVAALASGSALASEEVQYKSFKLDDLSCEVGLLYKNIPDGMQVTVSAIAYGKGSEFRKWKITDIRISMGGLGGTRIKPKQTTKFFVKKENFWKYPSAVLFAVIGAQIPASGSSLEKGITRTGAAIGLGILTLAAEGDITGEKCVFYLDSSVADRIIEGADAIEITVENSDIHKKEVIKIGLAKGVPKAAVCEECLKMDQAELIDMVNRLEVRVKELEAEQGAFKYGTDPQYDKIQRDIESIQTKRGIAYQLWLEREPE